MQRKVLIGIFLLVLIVVLALLVWRKDHGMSQVQRDISESLERAKGLKAQRDSMNRLVEQHRFQKKKVEEAEKEEEVEKAGEAGRTGEAEEAEETGDPSTKLRAGTGEEVVVISNDTGPVIHGDVASVPEDRFFTTSGMDGLTPLGKQSVFRVGHPVYIYAGIHAPQAEQVRLEWIDPSGKPLLPSEYVDIQSNTGVNGYRIYKQRKFHNEGKYEVRLYNASGELIGKTEFTISGDY